MLENTVKETSSEDGVFEFLPMDEDSSDGDSDDQNTKKIIERLRKSGIADVESGIFFCGGEESFYVSILNEYTAAYEEKKAVLDETFKSGNYKDMRITIHALKSTSKTIGASELSQKAYEIEKACENEDSTFIENNYESFMEDYRIFRDDLNKILGN